MFPSVTGQDSQKNKNKTKKPALLESGSPFPLFFFLSFPILNVFVDFIFRFCPMEIALHPAQL